MRKKGKYAKNRPEGFNAVFSTKNKKGILNFMNKTKRMTETAVCLSIGVVLEVISQFIPFLSLPFGGSFTFGSMVPLVVIAYRYGTKWGLFSGFIFSILQMLTGMKTVIAFFMPSSDSYEGVTRAIFICLLDYVIAFTLLGLAGFARSAKTPSKAMCIGSIIGLSARYVTHIVSGTIFFGSWAEWFFTQEGFYAFGSKIVENFSGISLSIIYSVFYNGLFMIPEIIITAIVVSALGKIKMLAQKY